MTWVGVAGFEPAASSSRSQVPMRTTSAVARLAREAPSLGVCWRLSRWVRWWRSLLTWLLAPHMPGGSARQAFFSFMLRSLPREMTIAWTSSRGVWILSVWLPVVVSSAGAAAVTLLGAVTGGAIAGRSQRMHWRRDKQIEACTAIVAESTRTQLALRRLWRRNEKVDWTPWNEALAVISLVGTPNSIHSAGDMDAAFWSSTSHMEEIGTVDERLGLRLCYFLSQSAWTSLILHVEK